MLKYCRESNRLAQSTISFRVQVAYNVLRKSKTLAEEHLAQLKKLHKKMEMQSKTSNLILTNVKSGFLTL